MTPGERYKAKALELLARAQVERDPQLRTEFETLAAAFLRLAEQAERNTKFVIDFEMPPASDCDPKSKP
jgi:hypothetical protein